MSFRLDQVNFTNSYQVEIGMKLTKIWTITNTGIENWPETIRLVQVKGQKLSERHQSVPLTKPGETC